MKSLGTHKSPNPTVSDRKKESILTKPSHINDDWWDLKQRALKARAQGRKARAHLREASEKSKEIV